MGGGDDAKYQEARGGAEKDVESIFPSEVHLTGLF